MFLQHSTQALVIISERIGDAIFCTPAIRFLKKQCPRLKITILSLSHASSEVFANNPDVEKIVTKPSLEEFLALAKNHEVLIDLHHSKKTFHYVAHWSKTAYLSPRAGLAHQSQVALEFIQHLVGGDLSSFDARYRLYVQPTHVEQAKNLLQAHLSQADREHAESLVFIGCHMGCYKVAQRLRFNFFRKSKLSNKSWPLEYFAALQKMLYEKYPNVRLVLTGTASEAKLLGQLDKKIPNVISLFGKTSILTLKAMMENFKVFLTGDTGPLHVAASTETPITALFFATSADQTGPRPLRAQHHVLYNPDAFAVKPQMVFSELEKYLKSTKP